MPRIRFHGFVLNCEQGENVRQILRRNGLPPYNGSARFLNCRGLGTCGTCAVEIKGAVSTRTRVEKWRLNFPPHKEENGLRLACQCNILGDIEVKKYKGFWGEKVIS
jgi:ferredoxin